MSNIDPIYLRKLALKLSTEIDDECMLFKSIADHDLLL